MYLNMNILLLLLLANVNKENYSFCYKADFVQAKNKILNFDK